MVLFMLVMTRNPLAFGISRTGEDPKRKLARKR